MAHHKDGNGNVIFLGDTLTNLYQTGNPDGIVVRSKGKYFVRDSDGDLLTLKSVLKNKLVVKKIK